MKEETIELLNRLQETKEIIGRDLTPDETTLLKSNGFDYIMDNYFQIPKELRNTLKHANRLISLYCSGNKKDYLKELSYESCENLSEILNKISSDLKNTAFDKKEQDRNKFTEKDCLDNEMLSGFEDFLIDKEKEINTSDLKPLNTELNGNKEDTNLEEVVKEYSSDKKFDITFSDLVPKVTNLIASMFFPTTIPVWLSEDMVKQDFLDIMNRMDTIVEAYKECVKVYKERLGIES